MLNSEKKSNDFKKGKDLEDFKKNHLKKIDEVAKSKTEWLKPFQEIYQQNRNSQKTETNKEFHEMLNFLKNKK